MPVLGRTRLLSEGLQTLYEKLMDAQSRLTELKLCRLDSNANRPGSNHHHHRNAEEWAVSRRDVWSLSLCRDIDVPAFGVASYLLYSRGSKPTALPVAELPAENSRAFQRRVDRFEAI